MNVTSTFYAFYYNTSMQKNENRGPTYFYEPPALPPFDPYVDFPPPPAVGRGSPRNLPPNFSPGSRGGSWGRGGRGGRGGGRGGGYGKQGGSKFQCKPGE